MTKVTFALGIINYVRRHKNAPLARYCCLLTLAENHGNPMTAAQIFNRFGLNESMAGTLDYAIRQDLIKEVETKPVKRFAITPAGEQWIAELLNSPTEISAGTASL